MRRNAPLSYVPWKSRTHEYRCIKVVHSYTYLATGYGAVQEELPVFVRGESRKKMNTFERRVSLFSARVTYDFTTLPFFSRVCHFGRNSRTTTSKRKSERSTRNLTKSCAIFTWHLDPIVDGHVWARTCFEKISLRHNLI